MVKLPWIQQMVTPPTQHQPTAPPVSNCQFCGMNLDLLESMYQLKHHQIKRMFQARRQLLNLNATDNLPGGPSNASIIIRRVHLASKEIRKELKLLKQLDQCCRKSINE